MDAELRKDLIMNRWVLISPRRGKRPHDYNAASPSLKQQASQHPGPCAFCYNHENETGPELLAFHNEGCGPNEPCWRVRVVQNKYPAVSSDLPFPSEPLNVIEDDSLSTHSSLPGFGSHEVVIETPEHDQVFTSLAVDQITEIFRAYRSRIETLRADPRYKYCQIFKNNGNAAGASMVHSHSQIITLPIVPKAAEDEYVGSKAFYENSGKCVFCEVIEFDLGKGNVRLIDQSPSFITIAPYAARFPYETWVLPRKHKSNFGTISDDEITGLAEILKLTLCKMDKGFNCPPFNFMLQMAPLQDSEIPYYHWHIRIVPHLTSIAGFELGSGCHINPVSPENAAEFLRGINLDDEVEEAQHSNGANSTNSTNSTNSANGSSGINGTTDHEPSQRLINMAELGKDKKDEEPQRVIYMADLGKNDPEKLIQMADLGKKDPERLIYMSDLGKKDPERLIYMADLGKHDPEKLIYMADLGKHDPEKLIYMADIGKNDNPPERQIHMADL